MGEEIRNWAFEDYKRGMKYKDIAEKYGVSLSAVKSWAARYWKKEGCNQDKKKSQPKKKKVATKTKGAQPENRNAAGHGGTGPPGNKNALKTGEFEALFFHTLEPEERCLIGAMPTDKESLLLHEIQLLTVREKRMLQRIEDVRTAAESEKDEEPVPGMTIVKRQSGIDKDKETDMKEYQGKLGQIQAIEEALTRVQARKQKAIDSLHRFGFDDARLEIELLKLEMMSTKLGGQDTEPADDGFLDALNAEAGALWGDTDGD